MSALTLTPPEVRVATTTTKRSRPVVSLLKRLNAPRQSIYYVVHVSEGSTRTSSPATSGSYAIHRPETCDFSLGHRFADELDETTLAAIGATARHSARLPTTMNARWVSSTDVVREFDYPLWLSEVVKKTTELLSLPANWDSYGARTIRSDCIEYAVNTVLASCMQDATPTPAVVPLNTGGVMLEWHCQKIDLEVKIEEPGHVHMYFADAKDNTEIEGDLDDNLAPLAVALSKLTQRA